MMPNMSSVIAFFSKKIIVRQRQQGTWVGPKFVQASPEFINKTIKAVVQPANARDLNILPEGERQKQIISVWSLEKINMSGDNVDIGSDFLLINNQNYKVIHYFDRLDNKFFKVLAEYIPE